MNVLALVKYSLDVAEMRVDSDTEALRLRGVPERFGDADKGIVEAAVRLKEADGGSVRLLCLGPPAAAGAAKDLLAIGADEATIITDPFDGSADPVVVVGILEAAIRKYEGLDLVVCGFGSDDGYTQQVGPRLAERLGWPLVSHAQELGIADGALTVARDLDDRVETVQVPAPVVVSIAEEAFEARRVSLLDAMKARKKPMAEWALEDLHLDRETLEASRTYAETKRKGIVVRRKQRVLKGEDLPELADRLIEALIEEGVVKEAS